MDRTTHHVRLTAAGVVFLVDARQIRAHVERAAVAAQWASRSRSGLRVGVLDASYDPLSLILHEVACSAPPRIWPGTSCTSLRLHRPRPGLGVTPAFHRANSPDA